MMLQAFAYWEETPTGGFRRGTLLVSNGDERIVGNAVLKNPGSARPLETVSHRDDGRLEFSVDPTMHALAELFGIDKAGGTVRLFNLSNVREANFSKAKKLIAATEEEDDVSPFIANGPAVPTYLGWRNLYKNKRLRAKAEAIFTLARTYNPCLKPRMEDNPFFHPMYLMRYGKSKKECQEEVERFQAVLK